VLSYNRATWGAKPQRCNCKDSKSGISGAYATYCACVMMSHANSYLPLHIKACALPHLKCLIPTACVIKLGLDHCIAGICSGKSQNTRSTKNLLPAQASLCQRESLFSQQTSVFSATCCICTVVQWSYYFRSSGQSLVPSDF